MSASEVSVSKRQDVISKLCNSDEGLAVLFETIATIYQHDSKGSNDETDGQAPSEDWTVIGYGIPSVVATKSKLTLRISDFDENLPGHEITISSTTQLAQISDYFTVIGIHNGTYFGLCFSDEAIAKKITSLISLVVPNLLTPELEGGSTAKRIKLSNSSMEGESNPNGDNDWVMIDREEAATESTDGGGTDNVDSPSIFRRYTLRRKSRSRSNSPLTISDPLNFRHISHVGEDTSVGQLSKSMTASVGDSIGMSSEPRPQAHRESGTESTFSFGEVFESGPGGSAVPPPPPPPIAPPPPPPPPTSAMDTLKKMGAQPLPGMSLQDELLKGVSLRTTSATNSSSDVAGSIAEELKRGIVLRPVGHSGKNLPRPPSPKNKGQLLFEINTFKRNTLRHVETTDFQKDDPDSLQSVLKSSLEKMRSKLNMRNFSRVADVNGNGEEYGFEDDYDSALIV